MSDLISERIVTEDDIELLANLGIDEPIIEEMIAGTAGDENAPRLEKETILRLRDPATRDAAIRDIKALAQTIVDAGWSEKMPDIHAEALNLVTVAGISPVSASHAQSDVKLVMDFIAKSDDQNVRNILADLQSDDPDTVAAAKTRAQDIAHTQREGLGLALLKNHIRGISDAQIELLQKHIPVAQYTEALQHIVDRDSFMDGAVSYFESMIKTAGNLEDEAQKIAKYNSYVKVDLFADQANVARATAKGYTPAELGKINRAANLFMAITPGVTQEQALVEVMTPGYKANRLMGYGGRFMDDPETFEQGLKLLDDFATWFSDLDSQTSLHGTPTSLTAVNKNGDLGKKPYGLECVVFEEVAANRSISLSGKPEDIFGMENNPAMRFFGRDFAAGRAFTLLQMPPEKRAIIFRCTDLLLPITESGNNAANKVGPTTVVRILRHFGELERLQAQGQLTRETVWATCFHDAPPLSPQGNPAVAIDSFLRGVDKRVRDHIKWADGAIPTPEQFSLYTFFSEGLDGKGYTFADVRGFAERGEEPPSPELEVPFTTRLYDIANPQAALTGLTDDFCRPTGYGRISDPDGAGFVPNPRFIVNLPGAQPLEFPAVAGKDEPQHVAKISTLSTRLQSLCGQSHPRQLTAVYNSLSQSALMHLRKGFPALGISSSEHSAVTYTLSRNDVTGAITVRYDSPSGCPITFNWSATIDIDGRVTMTPIQITSLPPPPAAAPAKPATVDGTATTATVTTATGTTTTATVTTTTGTDAQPSTGATVRSLMGRLQGLMSYAGEKSVTSVSADELKSVLADTNLKSRKIKALGNIARQTADAFVRLDRLDPADIGAAYRAGLSEAGLDAIQEAMKTDPAKKSVYQAALILKDAINTQANLSESLRIVLRGVELSDDQYGAIMDMRLMCDRRIAEINSLGLELSTMDAQGARAAADGRSTTQMLGAKTAEMHGNVDVFEALKGTPSEPSAADRLAGMLESFKDRETVLTKQEFTELSRTVQELNFDLLRFEHSGAVAPNGVKMDKAVLAAARGVLGELLSKLEPPLMHGDSLVISTLKDFARRSYSLGDSPLLSDKAIAVYRDAGLNALVTIMELCKKTREAAEAVIADPWDHEAHETLLKCAEELHKSTGEDSILHSGTSNDFGTIAQRGVAILDAASQESKDAFSPSELEAFTRALAGKKGVFNSALERMEMFNAHGHIPLAEHIVDVSQKAAWLANSATMTGEAVHAIVSGRASFGTTVELLAHGLGPNDAPPPGIDDAHLDSSASSSGGGVRAAR